MDEATNPRALPEAYDVFLLDDRQHPGTSVITSGGERAAKIEGMQSPGEAGAVTVDRGDELGAVSYRIEVWAGQQLADLGPYLAFLRAAQKRKNGRRQTLELVDLRLEHNGYDRVNVEKVGPVLQTAPGSGRWYVDVSFKEWRKRTAKGGPVRPRNPELDAANRADQEASEALKQAANDLGSAIDKAGG